MNNRCSIAISATAKIPSKSRDAAELDGLPQDYLDRHKPGTDGKIRITTDYPDVLPALRFSKSDKLRRRLWVAFDTRAYPKNRDVLEQMMQTRYEIAALLGYQSWADYNAADKMIVNGPNIAGFIERVDAASRPLVLREFQMLLAEKQKTRSPRRGDRRLRDLLPERARAPHPVQF